MHPAQPSRCRNCAPLDRGPLQAFEAASNGRKFRKRLVQAQTGVPRDGSDADFIVCNRRDVQLAVGSPIKLHTTRPRPDTIVATESETLLVPSMFVETRPLAYPGMSAVGTDN